MLRQKLCSAFLALVLLCSAFPTMAFGADIKISGAPKVSEATEAVKYDNTIAKSFPDDEIYDIHGFPTTATVYTVKPGVKVSLTDATGLKWLRLQNNKGTLSPLPDSATDWDSAVSFHPAVGSNKAGRYLSGSYLQIHEPGYYVITAKYKNPNKITDVSYAPANNSIILYVKGNASATQIPEEPEVSDDVVFYPGSITDIPDFGGFYNVKLSGRKKHQISGLTYYVYNINIINNQPQFLNEYIKLLAKYGWKLGRNSNGRYRFTKNGQTIIIIIKIGRGGRGELEIWLGDPGDGSSDEFDDGPGGDPSDDPKINPGDDPKINPGDDPKINPGDDPKINPGDDPKINPGDDPKINPGDDPKSNPSDDPKINPGDDPKSNPDSNPNKELEYYPNTNIPDFGKKFKVSSGGNRTDTTAGIVYYVYNVTITGGSTDYVNVYISLLSDDGWKQQGSTKTSGKTKTYTFVKSGITIIIIIIDNGGGKFKIEIGRYDPSVIEPITPPPANNNKYYPNTTDVVDFGATYGYGNPKPTSAKAGDKPLVKYSYKESNATTATNNVNKYKALLVSEGWGKSKNNSEIYLKSGRQILINKKTGIIEIIFTAPK